MGGRRRWRCGTLLAECLCCHSQSLTPQDGDLALGTSAVVCSPGRAAAKRRHAGTHNRREVLLSGGRARAVRAARGQQLHARASRQASCAGVRRQESGSHVRLRGALQGCSPSPAPAAGMPRLAQPAAGLGPAPSPSWVPAPRCSCCPSGAAASRCRPADRWVGTTWALLLAASTRAQGSASSPRAPGSGWPGTLALAGIRLRACLPPLRPPAQM